MWLVLIFRAAGVHVLRRLAITLDLQGLTSSAGGVLLYVLNGCLMDFWLDREVSLMFCVVFCTGWLLGQEISMSGWAHLMLLEVPTLAVQASA